MTPYTTIKITVETKVLLRSLCKEGESLERGLRRLLRREQCAQMGRDDAERGVTDFDRQTMRATSEVMAAA